MKPKLLRECSIIHHQASTLSTRASTPTQHSQVFSRCQKNCSKMKAAIRWVLDSLAVRKTRLWHSGFKTMPRVLTTFHQVLVLSCHKLDSEMNAPFAVTSTAAQDTFFATIVSLLLKSTNKLKLVSIISLLILAAAAQHVPSSLTW